MNFSFPAWCWEEWQERLSPWRWGFQLTGTTLMSLITRLPLASVAASLQPWIYIYLSCCHLYFRRSTTLSLLHLTHKFPWGWPASCALPTLPSTLPHTHTYRHTHTHTHTHTDTHTLSSRVPVHGNYKHCVNFTCTTSYFYFCVCYSELTKNLISIHHPLEEEMATHPSILAWRIPMDREAWWATVHRIAKRWTLLKWLSMLTHHPLPISPFFAIPPLLVTTTLFPVSTWLIWFSHLFRVFFFFLGGGLVCLLVF